MRGGSDAHIRYVFAVAASDHSSEAKVVLVLIEVVDPGIIDFDVEGVLAHPAAEGEGEVRKESQLTNEPVRMWSVYIVGLFRGCL